jgi:hypothetical protein
MIARDVLSEVRNMSESQEFNPQPDPPGADEDEYADFNPQPDPPGETAEPPDDPESELNPQPEPPG